MSELPPVIELLKNEMFESLSADTFYKSAKKLIPELKKQAEWSAENYIYADEQENISKTKFAVSPVSGINPFGSYGKCSDLDCRIHSALNFSRTLGLYSDVIYLADPFNSMFLRDDKWSEKNILSLLKETAVLKTLQPLIEAGVIQFISPVKSFCSGCMTKFDEQVDDFSNQAIAEFWNEISVESHKEFLAVNTGGLHEPSLYMHKRYDSNFKQRKNNTKAAREIFTSIVYEEIHEHILTMKEAAGLNSTILSNSRVGLKTLKKLEGINQEIYNPIDWEKSRTAVLPWIKNLSPTQVVELRDSASNAIPQFREFMLKNLTLNSDPTAIDNEKKCAEFMLELRAQASEVKSELDAININSEKKFHNVAGTLGLSIGIYSAAASNPVMGLTALIATLGLIHTNLKKDNADVDKLKAKPGYMLIKAQEILEHAN